MNKKDLRVIKTKNTIYNALIVLMKEKTFEEIKVSDICNTALINRSTFYAHYTDKYELLSEWINELKSSFTKELKINEENENPKKYYLELIKIFLDHIDTKRDIYLTVMANNRNSIMMDIIYDVLDNDIISHVQNDNNSKIPSKVIAKFYLGAVFNVGIEWLKYSNKYTKEDILHYLDLLIPDEINK